MYNLARHNLQIEYQPWLLGCLATELGMGWRAGSTDFFFSPYLMVRYDPTWRCHCGDLSAPGQFPMGCKWQRFLGKNFSVTWKCGPPISNKLILAVFGLCRIGSPPPVDETPADELRWNLWPLDDNCCPFAAYGFSRSWRCSPTLPNTFLGGND